MAIVASVMGSPGRCPVVPGHPHLDGEPHHGVRDTPPAGGTARHPTGGAGLYPGLAVRHRPSRGILAIGIHTTGALGKLFSELSENADLKPVEGIRSAGGTGWRRSATECCRRFCRIPQLRAAAFRDQRALLTIIGFVGAAASAGTETGDRIQHLRGSQRDLCPDRADRGRNRPGIGTDSSPVHRPFGYVKVLTGAIHWRTCRRRISLPNGRAIRVCSVRRRVNVP